MNIITTVDEMQQILQKEKRKVGFVPTMGALHDGHISLVEQAIKQSDIIVVSIFVNPTQFNDATDLEKYPRTLEKDSKLLDSAGVTYLFAPTVSEVYPKEGLKKVNLDLGDLANVMEGTSRPGHFDGVVEVVHRLLDIVKPDSLYMGQKDFQQFTIIQHMINELNMGVELVVCPIKREPHGLAQSSRNERLKPKTRAKAYVIYKVLRSIKRRRHQRTIPQLMEYAAKKLNSSPFKLEYLAFADGHTLQPIDQIVKGKYAVACIGVWADDVRLIDNIILERK